jgi:hypothetical protein
MKYHKVDYKEQIRMFNVGLTDKYLDEENGLVFFKIKDEILERTGGNLDEYKGIFSKIKNVKGQCYTSKGKILIAPVGFLDEHDFSADKPDHYCRIREKFDGVPLSVVLKTKDSVPQYYVGTTMGRDTDNQVLVQEMKARILKEDLWLENMLKLSEFSYTHCFQILNQENALVNYPFDLVKIGVTNVSGKFMNDYGTATRIKKLEILDLIKDPLNKKEGYVIDNFSDLTKVYTDWYKARKFLVQADLNQIKKVWSNPMNTKEVPDTCLRALRRLTQGCNPDVYSVLDFRGRKETLSAFDL